MSIWKKSKAFLSKINRLAFKISKSEDDRKRFWAGRKAAFPACGVLALIIYVWMDPFLEVNLQKY